MMRALVVYESMFGNTRAIAETIADGVAVHMPAEAVEVGSAPAAIGGDVRLLVVGGPTHAFGLSRPSTREDAAKQSSGPLVSGGIGIREWIAALSGAREGMAVAVFDTRIDTPRLPGSAARAAAKRLRKRGFDLLAPPETFYVGGSSGPLIAGETDRARDWGATLGAAELALTGTVR